MEDGLKDVDIIRMLRMQLERMKDLYPITREYYEFFTDYKKHAKEDALIMHPGPMNRGIEIDASLADDINRSIIVQQVEMGVAVRMACLKILWRTKYEISNINARIIDTKNDIDEVMNITMKKVL